MSIYVSNYYCASGEIMFYDRLKLICEERGVSLRSLALTIGTTSSTFGTWRSGAVPSITFLVKIADYFNVSCDWLLERTDDPAPPDASGQSLVLSDDERFFIDNLRECDTATRQRALICGLVVMGCVPNRDQLPSLRNGPPSCGDSGSSEAKEGSAS